MIAASPKVLVMYQDRRYRMLPSRFSTEQSARIGEFRESGLGMTPGIVSP